MQDGFKVNKIIKEAEAEDLSMYSVKSRRKTVVPDKQNKPIVTGKTITLPLPNNEKVNLPTIEWVESVEKENAELRRQLENLKNTLHRLTNKVNTQQKKQKESGWFD